jgi:peptidoglycan/xylan/chitin deacetylase (PgdA/CDA1 family)
MAFIFVALEVASFEDKAGDATASRTLLLLYTALGYAFSVVILSLQVVLLDPLQLYYSGAYRAASVDYFSLTGLVCTTSFVLYHFSDKTPVAVAFLAKAWAASGAPAAETWLVSNLPYGIGHWAASWQYAIVGAAMFLLASVLVSSLSRSSLLLAPYYANVIARGNPRTGAAAITFNGEPSETDASRLLQVLAAANAKATFFLPGKSVTTAQGRALIQRLAAAGHEIGLLGQAGPHTTSEVIADIQQSRNAVSSALLSITGSANAALKWYRPADGSRDMRVLRSACAAGLGVAYWSVCPYDWDGTAEQIKDRTEEQLGLHQPAQAVTQSYQSGALEPRIVRGAIVRLHASLPDYLIASPAAGKPKHDVVAATEAVLRVLLSQEAGLKADQLVTMSKLCPDAASNQEVIPVA